MMLNGYRYCSPVVRIDGAIFNASLFLGIPLAILATKRNFTFELFVIALYLQHPRSHPRRPPDAAWR